MIGNIITKLMHLQNPGVLKMKGFAFSSFFHVPKNGHFQKRIILESGQKDHLFYWLQFATR